MQRRVSRVLFVGSSVLGFGMLAILAGRAWASGPPTTGALTYSGVLEDAAGALSGSHKIQVTFWNAANNGASVCSTTPATQTVPSSGRFTVALPDACTTAVKASPDVWAEVLVDDVSLGRAKLGAVPYAVESGHATSADSATSSTSATTAATANAAGGALDTRLKALESKLGTPSGFRAQRTSGTVSVLTNTAAVVAFDTVDYDLNSEFSVATNAFTPKNSGYYLVTCFPVFDGPSTTEGWLQSQVTVNNVGTVIADRFLTSVKASTRASTGVLYLSAGDKVTCGVYHETGASVSYRDGSWFQATRLAL